ASGQIVHAIVTHTESSSRQHAIDCHPMCGDIARTEAAMSQFEDRVLGLVARSDYRPITLKAMSRQFKIGPDDYAEFRSVVKGLVKAGRLDMGKDKTLAKTSEKGAIVGTFRRTSKGFGFVRPKASQGRANDIFIPPDAGLDASTGDEVAVRIMKRSHTPG